MKDEGTADDAQGDAACSGKPDAAGSGKGGVGHSARKVEDQGPVPVPPPLFYALALFAGAGLDRLHALPMLDMPWSAIIGNGLMMLSLIALVPVLRRFRAMRTSFNVRRPACTLITEGPYRYSRNPAYLCLTVIYISLAILWNSIWIALLVLPVLWLMNAWVVPREERHLEARFGADYRRYCARVPRWW